jgi:anaerobic selenocysteine-containing dehydrogenase
MLHPLQEARKRNVPIITFNPIRERGLERFVNPQSPREMVGPESTVISTQYHQVAIGGDTAAVMGMIKALLVMERTACEHQTGKVLDQAKVPKDKIESLFGFKVPERKGLATVDTCEGMLDGSVKGFIALGGNFLRAIPDTDRMEPAWAGLTLNVQIATKLNRSHLLPGKHAWLLPCLGRIEMDRQDGVEQVYSTEDSTGCIRGWQGRADPASDQLRSETAIIAGIAQATLDGNEGVPWEAWRRDYALIRASIAQVYPEIFHDMETRCGSRADFTARYQRRSGSGRPRPARRGSLRLAPSMKMTTSPPATVRTMSYS